MKVATIVARQRERIKKAAKDPKLILDYGLTKLWLPLGWFLAKIPNFQKTRDNHFNQLYLKNPNMDIKKESMLWYHLNRAYTQYLFYKYRNLPQEQWQQKHWEDYAEIYYGNRAGVKLLPKFEGFFTDAVNKYHISSVLDIGCGGWQIERILYEKHPTLNFVGIDITDKSLEIYNRDIKTNYKNISFTKGSIFQHLALLKSVQLFFTYGVFIHFDETEIKLLFQYIADLPHQIIGVIQKPYIEEGMTKHYPSAPKDYCHNFKKYIQDYNFKLLNADTAGTFGIFYFSTK